MRFLFQDEEFKARLFELAKNDKIVAGAPCPALDCNGVLRSVTLSYMSKDFELQSVNVLQCGCGFQFRKGGE
jgi:hypothetical protein